MNEEVDFDADLEKFLMRTEIGRRLRILMAWREISGTKLSAKTGVPAEYISMFSNGYYRHLRGDRIKAIAKYLQAPDRIFREVLE